MIQSNWDPSDEDPGKPQLKRAHPGLGIDWETQQSQMHREWLRFEQRLEEYANQLYFDRGVGLSDAEKSAHRRRFERKMSAIYGSAYADARWTEEHMARIQANREASSRVSRG